MPMEINPVREFTPLEPIKKRKRKRWISKECFGKQSKPPINCMPYYDIKLNTIFCKIHQVFQSWSLKLPRYLKFKIGAWVLEFFFLEIGVSI